MMPSFQQLPTVTKNLLVINIIIYVVMALSPVMADKLDTYAALHYFSSPGFRPWQLVTYMFLHGGFMHLLFNMFALYFFGPVVERVLGKERFLLFYLICGVGAALVQEGVFAWLIHNYSSKFGSEAIGWLIDRSWYWLRLGQDTFNDFSSEDQANFIKYGFLQYTQAGVPYYAHGVTDVISMANTAIVGASGAIYGILGAAAMLFPNAKVYLYFAIPMKLKWLVIGYAVLELVQGVGGYASTVAHFAHLGGLLFAVILILYWKKKGLFNDRWFF